MLLAKGISHQTIDSKLHITKGDGRDTAAIKTTLVLNGKPVSRIVSGIGMVPGWYMDTTICQDFVRHILAALGELAWPPAQRPFLTVISTTGISKGRRDVPLMVSPLYHVLLAAPHKDKSVMEELVIKAGEKGDKISGWCIVRSSFLFDGKAGGKVRVGSEEDPAVGYKINRDEIGKWIFDETVQGDAMRWSGAKPTLTY